MHLTMRAMKGFLESIMQMNGEIVVGFQKPCPSRSVPSRGAMEMKMLSRLSVRQTMALISLSALALLAFGLYLQHVVGLEPCPMCIVQRYAFILIAVVAAAGAAMRQRWATLGAAGLMLLLAGFGAFVAARQSWLQWYPPEVVSCSRDFYGMIETFPLQRVVPMIFKGSGDCTAVDWTFLGGSIANWSFVCFVLIGLAALTMLWRLVRGNTALTEG
jgi:disulfide bond formation protein DsbB